MNAFSIFAFAIVMAFAAGYASPWLLFVIGIPSAFFPILMSWVFLKSRPRTAMLLFWVFAFSAMNAAVMAGRFLAYEAPGAAAVTAGLSVLCGLYVARLCSMAANAHTSKERFTPLPLAPYDPDSA